MTSFKKYWLTVVPGYDHYGYARVKDIAERAYEAGARHERNQQRHKAAIHAIIDTPTNDKPRS